jgi:hypothetical protein
MIQKGDQLIGAGHLGSCDFATRDLAEHVSH